MKYRLVYTPRLMERLVLTILRRKSDKERMTFGATIDSMAAGSKLTGGKMEC